MIDMKSLKSEKVFDFFGQICSVPRGSGNMCAISDFCVQFAAKRGLEVFSDNAGNVVIFKPGTKGYENSLPVILQGHLDMVCEKEYGKVFNFEQEAIVPFEEKGWVKADGTTLGADNGIAVAMILAILDSEDISHPPIEAVFTTDEEIGMIGATELDTSVLKGKMLVNLDSEEEDCITVSCAGGSDFKMIFPLTRVSVTGTQVTLVLKGLTGGHSGVEIDKGRVNANLLGGRILNALALKKDFDIISLNGGDKANAIASSFTARLVCNNPLELKNVLESSLATVKKEICHREPGFSYEIILESNANHKVLDKASAQKVISLLACAPDGVQTMSAAVDNLVETSLNLGVLSTDETCITAVFALRSNIQSALEALEEKMFAFADMLGCTAQTGGHYPPWEYRDHSVLREIYQKIYKNKFGAELKISAIHAGLECGVFAGKTPELDCISIGPDIQDVHTPHEKVNIASVQNVYEMVLELLERLK